VLVFFKYLIVFCWIVDNLISTDLNQINLIFSINHIRVGLNFVISKVVRIL
jgi:hypothetical protein